MPIIQQAIDNKPFVLQVVENLKLGKSTDCLQGTSYLIGDSNIPAHEFLKHLCFIWSRHPSHWNWGNVIHAWNMRQFKTDTSLNILSKLPKEHYDLLPAYVLTKVKQAMSKYTLDTKQLKFDDFAIATFTMWLESKKKLTSTECLDMLKQCKHLTNLNLPEHQTVTESKLKYINLLWKYTPSKSIALCKYYTDNFGYLTYFEQLPVASIGSHDNLINVNGEQIQDISFNLGWYQSTVRHNSIPVSQSIMTDQWSTVYTWVSGVPKSTPLTPQGIAIAIDQIIVLAVAELKYPNLAKPISKLKQQITDELLSDKYTDIKQRIADRLTNLTPIESALGALHERL